jgi:tryptophan synthase alpha chain
MKELFENEKRAAFIPFIIAGDPTLEASERFALRLLAEGADALEIGVPFSDAMADGPIIQAGSERALKNDVTLLKVLQLVERLHQRYPQKPLIVFSYLNPLLSMGLEAYARQAKAAGASATLVVDLPPEEAEAYLRFHREQNLKTIFLASPTSSAERIEKIANASSGFIYYVSRSGVTGVQQAVSSSLQTEIQSMRRRTDKPIAIGFGISTPVQAKLVSQIGDAVVVGSAFVQLIGQYRTDVTLAEEAIATLALSMMRAMQI